VKWLSHNPFHRQAIFISTVFHDRSKSAKVHNMRGGNILNYRMGEFLDTEEKYLKPGGKIIFHKL